MEDPCLYPHEYRHLFTIHIHKSPRTTFFNKIHPLITTITKKIYRPFRTHPSTPSLASPTNPPTLSLTTLPFSPPHLLPSSTAPCTLK